MRVSNHHDLSSSLTLYYRDINLVHKLIDDKTKEIDKLHREVYDLQTTYKQLQQDKEDVIVKLTKDNDEMMRK